MNKKSGRPVIFYMNFPICNVSANTSKTSKNIKVPQKFKWACYVDKMWTEAERHLSPKENRGSIHNSDRGVIGWILPETLQTADLQRLINC